MKKKTLFAFLASLCALALEISPWGAVLNFSDPEGDPIRKTYSYFSLVPYGNANFFPLMTAILSSLLVLFLLLSLIRKSEKAEKTAFYLSFGSVILSLLPPVQSLQYFSLVGVVISLFLAVCTLLLWKKGRFSS